MAKPEWWNDEELKALSAMVVRAAPDDVAANRMRAFVLAGRLATWERWGLARRRSSGRRPCTCETGRRREARGVWGVRSGRVAHQ